MAQTRLEQILLENIGQKLTRELAIGILQSMSPQFSPIALRGIKPKEYRGYVIQVEMFANCFAEVIALHRMQWEEIERDRPPLNPDYQRFVEAEREGRFVQVTVRKDGDLVGGCGFFIGASIQTQLPTAEETALYIRADHRIGMLASVLCRYCTDVLGSIGVKELVVTTKAESKVGVILERLKFKNTDVVYLKRLGV